MKVLQVFAAFGVLAMALGPALLPLAVARLIGDPAAKPGAPATVLAFQKIKISDEAYEAASIFDVNKDGSPDIVCGAWWYPGPKFDQKCPVGTLKAVGDYFDDFGVIPLDANGDGYTDFVTGGWFGKNVRWRENPKGDPAREWPEHIIADVGNCETLRGWDVDGDGQIEIVPSTPNTPLVVLKLATDAAGKGAGQFSKHVIYEGKPGMGLGFGDLNGDGRGDLVIQKGWLEAPEKPLGGAKWTLHEDFDLGDGGIPLVVADVNGDGLADLIVGQGHHYGLDWYEQKMEGGKRRWVKHPIDPANSQYHSLEWADIDGDGRPELVTGKRRHAHRGGDAGDADPAGVYYFKWTGEGFAKQVIDYGFGPAGKGCGIYFCVADADGDGRPDVVAPGKDGLVLYKNLGFAKPPPK
ncbi:MAG: VCBS repeat-containing protein [Planctomycetota bacterium]|nr:VCBS repeat-containing protein [Planctomycetota bacterium]